MIREQSELNQATRWLTVHLKADVIAKAECHLPRGGNNCGQFERTEKKREGQIHHGSRSINSATMKENYAMP